ncbi:YdeI/OmpD-associated family protein [Sphingobacterium anhuiense]|uniref:YdeI family protein n=1 Tax=Sphingobacterium anhuiense TaxID=493780 RepID=A0ABW5YW31_9SPHI
MNTQVEHFFEKTQQWSEEFNLLRDIITENKSLEEEYKWMHPCYTLDEKNIVLIHGFKEYCALLFHKGALLKDPEGILIQQTENVQAGRQIRFKHIAEIITLRPVIQAYIQEAVEIEKAGLKVELKKVNDYPIPEEFQQVLAQDQELNTAFYSLTPGRQKGYLFYFNQAKQSKTRQNRIEKYYQQILDRKGIDD